MHHRIVLIGLITLCLTVTSPVAIAQDGDGISVDECRTAVHDDLAYEQRLYRSVIFGQPPPEDAPIGFVRFAKDGSAWIKAGDNQWRTVDERHENETWSDSQMSDESELEDRRGIFNTKRVLTSEIVPHLTQTMRTLQCRSVAICLSVLESLPQDSESPQPIYIQPPGCIEYQRETYAACHFRYGEEKLANEGLMRTYCDNIAKKLLEREADMLKLAVEYDAAYRSMLQFAGSFDLSLDELRWPMMNTVSQAASVIGQLERNPCFLGSCMGSEMYYR